MRTGDPVVVMLGDSLTAGYLMSKDAALPVAVQRELAARGIKAKLVNAGVSGDTTAAGLERYDWSVAGAKPDLLVVALGANDFFQFVPAATAAQNLKAIIAKAKAANVPVALMGISAPEGAGAGSDLERDYVKMWSDVAKAEGVPLLADMLSPVHGKPELLMSDGVHPTEAGVEAMAEPVADFLAPLIEALPD